MADYEVVWDGRRNGPGGAQLFAPEGETKHVEPVYRVRHGVGPAVVAALGLGPATAKEVASLTEFPEHAVAAELRRLAVFGRVSVDRVPGVRGGRNRYTLARS